MRRETQDGIALEVPDGWLLDETVRPVSLQRQSGDGGVVQLSRLRRPEGDEMTPSPKRAAGWAYRVAARLTGGDVISEPAGGTPRVEIHPERLVRVETWQEPECVSGWLECRGADAASDDRFAVGFREWRDGAVVLTWIGGASDVSFRQVARRIFEGIERLD